MNEPSVSLHTLSSAMQIVYDASLPAAASDACILIRGESGVGKTWLAQRLHESSPRASNRMMWVNCCALSAAAFDGLFGHEKGAYYGATEAKPSLLEEASGGTVFLENIEWLPLGYQGQMGRAIETQSVYRVGAVEPRPINARFISTTDQNLEAQVATGNFRRDLYNIISKVTLAIPPLRERRSEIPELARRFVAQQCLADGRPEPEISAAVMAMLIECKWNDNITTLKLIVQRAAVLCEGGEIGPEHLFSISRGSEQQPQDCLLDHR